MNCARLLAFSVPLALAGCLGPADFRGWPDPPHKFADCTGAPNGLEACFERARALCPEGYQLAEQRSDPEINRNSTIVRCGLPAAPPEEPGPPAPTRRAPTAPTVPK